MKKILALLLAVVMVTGLVLPVHAATSEYSEDLKVKLDATTVQLTTAAGNKTALKFDYQIQANRINGTQWIVLTYDTTKLTLRLRTANYSEASITTTKAAIGNVLKISTHSDDNGATASETQGKKHDTGNLATAYLSMNNGSTPTTAWSTMASLANFWFTLNDGVQVADLTQSDLRFATVQETTLVGAASAAAICSAVSGSSGTVHYNASSSAAVYHMKSTPQLLVNGSALPAGALPKATAVTVSLKSGTAPTAVPKAGNTASFTLEAKPSADGTSGIKDVTWSVTPNNDGVAVSSAGVVTVSPSAKGSQAYTITADAKDSAGTAVTAGTYTLAAMTKETPAAATFTLSATTANLKPGATQQLSVTAGSLKDQYGAAFTGTPTWTVESDNSGGKITAPNGLITIASDAVSGKTATVKATIGTVSKTCAVTVASKDASTVTGLSASPSSPKVSTDFTVSIVGTSNGENITWSVESGPATIKTPSTGNSVTLTAGASTGTAVIKAVQGDSATKLGFTKTLNVTIADKDPSEKLTLTITGGGNSFKETDKVTLTATPNKTPANGSTTVYKWYKGDDTTVLTSGNGITITDNKLEIASLAAATEGTYKCELEYTETGKGMTKTDKASATVAIKGMGTATIAKVAKATQRPGALDLSKLVTVTGTTFDKAKSKITADVYVKGSDGAYTAYTETTLAEGEYAVDVDIAAGDDGTNAWVAAAKLGSAPTTDLTGYVELTVKKASGGGASGYTVTYVAGDKGTLTGSATETVYSGTPKSVPTVTAKAGYTFKGWSLDGKTVVDPKTVTITESVTFTALYNDDNECYIKGYGNGLFLPKNNVTRAEVATMLAKLSAEFDKDEQFTVANKDIKAGDWYEAFMKYAVKTGMITGDDQGNYRPESYITRGEFAKMLATYLKLDLTSGAGAAFGDVSGWAATYANALKKAGITKGYEDGLFRQNNRLTREEAVAMINRAVKLSATAGETYKNNFNDVTNDSWAYGDIMAAANTPISKILSK